MCRILFKVHLRFLAFIAMGISCVAAGTNGNGESNGHIQIKETSPTYVPQRCLVDPEPGRCRAWLPHYFFNTSTGHCQEFIYGGCGGNWNRFETVEECQQTCTCKTAPETGPCRGHIRRWFYSPRHGVCRPFVFGGCGGNANNYESWYECSSSCGYPDPNNSWWNWWQSGGRTGEVGADSSRGYTKADFMKDYMMLGMVGEIELEGIGDIMNLYMQLQSLGGLSTMQSGQSQGAVGSNLGTAGFDGMRSTGLSLSELSEGMEGLFLGEGSSALESILRLNSGISNHNTDAWQPGPSAQTGALGASQWTANGFALGDASSSYTPLGFRGGPDGTFTRLGERGSLSNVMGTGSSNMANEIEVLKSIVGNVGFEAAMANFGTGGTGSFDFHGWAPNGGFNIVEFIKHLANGRLTPNAMMFLARMLGAMDSTGRIDMNIMLSQLSQTLANLRLASGEQLKGVAQMYGALDMNGNIDMKRFLQGIGGAMGGLVFQMRNIMGPGGVWPAERTKPNTAFVTFIQHLGSGRLSPTEMLNMAKRLGVLNSKGEINIQAMVQGLMDALSNPGIAADLKGTARRLGAVDSNGNINVQMFLSRIAGSMGNVVDGSGLSATEILNFLSHLASRRASMQDLNMMASKAGAISGVGNINLGHLAKGIVGALMNPVTTADLKNVARRMGALDSNGNINIALLLRAIAGALKGELGMVGGTKGIFAGAGGHGWSLGGLDRPSETAVFRGGRSVRRSKRQANGYDIQ